MDKIILQTYDLSDLSSPIKTPKNKEFYINTSINNKETKFIDYSNKKNFEEEKNTSDSLISFNENNIINNRQNENYLPIDTLSDKLTEENINSDSNLILNSNSKSNKSNDFTYFNENNPDNLPKNNKNFSNKKQKSEYIKNNYKKDDTSISVFNSDEKNIKYDYEKIQVELKKIKEEKKCDPIYIKMHKDVEENKNIDINNNFSFSKKINCKNEEDLFYYSFKDNNRGNLNEKSYDTSITYKELETKVHNEKNSNKEDINRNINNSDKDNNNNNNLNYNIKIDKYVLQNIEFAIDENGNPFNLKNYFKELKNKENQLNLKNNDNYIRKPVAFIMKGKEKDKNYLIDLNGELIPKIEDGYFSYKHNNIHIIIKDFDVQHPQLRVYINKEI